MKNYCAIIVLFLLCTQHTVFSMKNVKEDFSEDWFDKEDIKAADKMLLQTTEQFFDQICNKATTTVDDKLIDTDKAIATISTAIDKKKSPILSYFVTSDQMAQEYAFNIINTIEECSIVPNKNLITLLCQQNKVFDNAIANYKALAYQNVRNVTIDTLALIEDSTAVQPVALLNALSPVIKKYVMERPFSYSYNINLIGHTDKINFFDIHVDSRRAATSSKDKTLRLWNLENGQLIYTLQTNAHCLAFNSDGSFVASAENYQDGLTSQISIWETESAQLFHSIKHNTCIDTMCYNDNVLVICSGRPRYPEIGMFSVNKEAINIIHSVCVPYKISCFDEDFKDWNSVYRTKNPYKKLNNLESTLKIAKIDCYSFGLCNQAVKNTHSLTASNMVDKIEKLPIFKNLTDGEKGMIIKLITCKSQQTQTDKLLHNK